MAKLAMVRTNSGFASTQSLIRSMNAPRPVTKPLMSVLIALSTEILKS